MSDDRPAIGRGADTDAEELRRRVSAYEARERKRERVDAAVRDVLQNGGAGRVGTAFFECMVQDLANVLGADDTLIGQLVDPNHDQVQTLAICVDGKLTENIVYTLAGTPCENVIERQLCSYPSGVAALFPEDHQLAGFEGYIGVPLFSSYGATLGIMAALFRRPVEDVYFSESFLLLFAARTAGEIERLRSEQERQSLQAQVQHAQKMEAVGTLAGGIAHDFNNLLTGILGGIEVSLLDAPADSTMAANLQQARAAVERASELTRQLLTLSRKETPTLGPMDVNAVVEQTVKLLQRAIPETVQIRMATDPRICTIEGNAGQLGQALLNLGINARDAMPAGGLLTFETEVTTVDAAYGQTHAEARPGTYALVTVSDTGAGMPGDVLEHIFEPFFTTKDEGKGTGLGLAMVYACMQAHRGWLEVHSTPGSGTTFQLFLPLLEMERQPTVARFEAAPRGTETILLVDDTDAVLYQGRGMLERCGYRVLIAWNGEGALEVYQQHARDIALIVTDLIMPHAGGRDLLRELQRSGITVPVVLMSGYAVDGHPEELMAEGFAAFLAKPFDLYGIATTVRTVLDRPVSSAQS